VRIFCPIVKHTEFVSILQKDLNIWTREKRIKLLRNEEFYNAHDPDYFFFVYFTTLSITKQYGNEW
jgi:hypothetical protein